jgi:UDP-N-acetylglucosamine 2-epimerase
MYEKAFGFSAPPFQVNPDPSFYFESKGHSAAYQYLRFGAFQAEGFVVVTGEIGAGKTTLLRALLAELDPDKVVAAQLVSTQLGAEDLLAAVAQAFGINSEGLSKPRLLVTLEAYLARLATSNRRALLIIDEAQNLDASAIEELRMLSNFQFGNRALLQSFLVGQPELRKLLRSPQMEQLRQRVIASYHLGPMSEEETASYVRHRLGKVGWQGVPAFTDAALEAIHLASGGVPRRINTLCNRLLLSVFLDAADTIDAPRVRQVHSELRAEMDGGVDSAVPAVQGTWLLCIAASDWGVLACGAMMDAFSRREDMPEARMLRFLGTHAVRDEQQAMRDLRDLGVDVQGETVELTASSVAGSMAEASLALARRLEGDAPGAVVVAGDGPIDAACAVLASQAQVPVVRVDAGLRNGDLDDPRELGRAATDSVSALLLTGERAAMDRLGAAGVPEGSLAMVGALAADVTRLGLARSVAAERTLQREGLPMSLLSDPAGFVLVWLDSASSGVARGAVLALDRELRTRGWRLSFLWPMRAVDAALRQALQADAAASGVQTLEVRHHGELLGLMRHARCLLTDCGWLQDQATALGLSCLTIGPSTERHASLLVGTNRLVGPDAETIARELVDLISSGGRRAGVPELWDGHAAERIAARVSDWLLSRQDDSYRSFLDGT